MKEIFEEHRDRLTDAEDRRVWMAIHDSLESPRKRRTWLRVPVLVASAAAVVLVLRYTPWERLTGGPGGHPETIVARRSAENDRAEQTPAKGSKPAVTEAGKSQTSRSASEVVAAEPDNRVAAKNATEPPEGKAAPVAEDAATGAPVATQDVAQKLASATDVTPVAGATSSPLGATAAVSPRGATDAASPLSATAASRPDGTIAGRVTDVQGDPLAFATVALLGTRLSATADSAGYYSIRHVPPGRYTVRITKTGYEPNEIAGFVVDPELVASLECKLVEESMTMLNRTVGGEKEGRNETQSSTRQRVIHDELKAPGNVSREARDGKGQDTDQGGQLRYRGGRTGELAESPRVVGGVRLPPIITGRPPSPYGNSVGGSYPVNGQAFDAMFFEHYGVNPFIDAQEDALATFAVDVDNASWTMTRSYLDRNELPPKDAVRVEEFVNAFKHNYRAPRPWDLASREYVPSEKGTFAIYLDAASSPFGRDLTLLRVGLKGREVDVRDRKPAVLTFVIDVSGSMQMENRLELVKRALFILLDQMDRGDQVALVAYNTTARVILPHTSLRDRARIEAAIAMLHPDGSTNANAGLRLGYDLADRAFRRNAINRIILCSDGVANEERTAAEDIFEDIGAAARRGIELTAVGFGMGNYNDVLLEKLADKGDGNYYYVDDIDEARRVFVENLTGTLQTIARQVKIQVEFDPDVVRRYRQLGYENRAVADRDFRNDRIDAGEVGAGHEVTALFEVKLERQPRGSRLAVVRIRYEDPETRQVTEEARTLRMSDIRGDIARCDPSFQMDAAVAEFAEILRHSYWAQDGDFGQVERLARDAARRMNDRQDALEFIRLVKTADRLWPHEAPPEWRDDRVRPMWEPGGAEEDGRR